MIDRKEKIGMWGGTFDPVHLGHLLIAEQAREQFQLDEVRWLPAATAPHAQLKQATDSSHRLAMVQLAISGNNSFVCDQRELKRGGKSYTVDTLTEMQQEFPCTQLFLLIGADSLQDFAQWRTPDRICQLAHVVVVARGGQPEPDLQLLARHMPVKKSAQQWVDEHLLVMPQIELSSSNIRARIQQSKSIRYMVPAAVEAYIAAHRLYL